MYVLVHVCAMEHMWMDVRGQLGEVSFLPLPCKFRDQTQVVRLHGKHFNLLSYPTSPDLFFE